MTDQVQGLVSRRKAPGLPLVAWALCLPCVAQRASISPTPLEPGEVIRVDGVLDEALWGRAAVLGKLTVTEPIEGAVPRHPTEARLAYDRDSLYLGVRCYDDPSEVRARQRDRDAFVRYDDVVEVWIDTFNDQRFAFWFQLTAGGSRGDALLSDSGSSFNKNWDGIWYGRSRVTADGWQAEIALPFKTLAFKPDESTWGFNLRRKRIANGEEARWASPSVAYHFFNLEEGGQLLGMRGMEQGLGLDVVPYFKAGASRDQGAGEGAESNLDVGLDLTWRPMPSTTLRLTTNTDFAETEVDQRQVNLTRFPLFFPEKRDFFLEDAGMFEFGPSVSYRGGRGRGRGLMPFFSRTIGRDADGEAVPILGGLKLTGRMGDWNVGVLETRLDSYALEEGVSVPDQTLGVVRLSRNLGGENSVGVLMTHGRPDGGGSALTAGADFRLGSSRLFGEGRSGSLWGYYMTTDNEGEQDASAYGLKAQARTNTWEHTAETFVTEDGLDPKLGFVRRTGVEHYRYRAEYTWRGTEGSPFRTYEVEFSPHYDQDTVGGEDTLYLPLTWLDIEFWSEDSISIESQRIHDRLEGDGFDLSNDVTVSPGDYEMTRHKIQFRGSERRRLTGSLGVEFGDFFSGDILRTTISPVILPGALFSWRISFEDIQIELEEGNLDTQVLSTDLDFAFNPDLTWKNLVQYDTDSDDLAWQSRMRWIVQPGQDVYLVGLQGWDRSGRESFTRSSGDLALKVGYTWRF